MTARGSERFRNYGAVLERHEQEMRIKKIIRVFTLFAVILIVVMLIVIVVRWESRSQKEKTSFTTSQKINRHT
ncbi:MAG: hypothetical protein ACOYW3_11315 [Bacteroidota bacterium]